MPKFFATCPRGVEDALVQELVDLGAKNVTRRTAGVSFEGNWQTCYLANLKLRSASRVLYPVLDFPAYDPDQIYHNVLKHDWTKYIKVNQTLAVDSTVRDSIVQDLRIVSLKTKDAVVDQFRNKYDKRPDVDTENTDMQITVRLVRNECTVSLDTSGGSLHERGYRQYFGMAPIKENLAAALIELAKWKPWEEILLDPMCGSGTFLIEGALLAMKTYPGTFRKSFGFQKWLTYQEAAFDEAVQKMTDEELDAPPHPIIGYDKDGRVLESAKKNSKLAGTAPFIQFTKQSIEDLTCPGEKGLIIVNPPYGERLDFVEQLKDLYSYLGRNFRTKFPGWRMAVLSSEPDLIACLDMEPKKSYRVFNGAIECRFNLYE